MPFSHSDDKTSSPSLIRILPTLKVAALFPKLYIFSQPFLLTIYNLFHVAFFYLLAFCNMFFARGNLAVDLLFLLSDISHRMLFRLVESLS